MQLHFNYVNDSHISFQVMEFIQLNEFCCEIVLKDLGYGECQRRNRSQ